MMFAGIESEIKPFGTVLVGFEVFGSGVEIEINIFDDVAHD